MDYLWIVVMFLSAVWTPVLTAPIHCREFNGEQVMSFLQICFNEHTNLYVLYLGWQRMSTFSANLHFWVNYSFKNKDLERQDK